jgi:hypothetical protein
MYFYIAYNQSADKNTPHPPKMAKLFGHGCIQLFQNCLGLPTNAYTLQSQQKHTTPGMEFNIQHTVPEELSPLLYINLSVAKNFPFYVQDI